MQGNKGFGMEKQNHAPRKQHQHPPHPPPAGPANGQQANSQSECGAGRGGGGGGSGRRSAPHGPGSRLCCSGGRRGDRRVKAPGAAADPAAWFAAREAGRCPPRPQTEGKFSAGVKNLLYFLLFSKSRCRLFKAKEEKSCMRALLAFSKAFS